MRTVCTLALSLAVLCFGGATQAGARFEPIVVTVVEPDGVDRRAWPLTFSVPLPRGVLRDAAALTLTETPGASVPLQTRVLSRWQDGSIRWVLIDTQLSLSARQSKRLQVASGKRATERARVEVTEQADGVRIDTGALRFRIPTSHFGIIEAVEGGGVSVPGAMTSLIEQEGTRLEAQPPQKLTVIEKGPLRARVAMEGTFGNGLDYVIRVEAYAGQPFVRVFHTFIDRNRTPFVRMSRLAVEWPLAPKLPATYAVGLDGTQPRRGTLTGEGVRLIQPDNLSMRINDDSGAGKLAGWFAVQDKAGGVGLATRWFWQQYPQSVALLPERLAYNMWAPEAQPAVVGMGAAKTHEFVLWAGSAAQAEGASGAGAARPLVATLDPRFVTRTGALPHAIAPGATTDPFVNALTAAFDRYMRRNDSERWDDSGSGKCDGWFGERPRTGAYGMWNWGDWNFPGYHDDTKGCDAWGNLEYDTAQVLALAFVATGRIDMHEAMVVAARHFMDVDTIYYQAEHPEWVGMNHPKNPLHFTFEFGGVDLGHTWTEGLVSYFYLTGDERGLAAARGIADYLVRRSQGMIVRANPRQLGWPQIALLAVYEATGERVYLEAATRYAQRALRAYPADDVDHWKHGILADALASVHGATGDPEIERWLRTYAETISRRRKADDLRLLPGLAYVAAQTGDEQLRAAVLRRMEGLNLGGWGKPFTLNGRLGFRIYSLLATAPAFDKSRDRHPPPRQPRRKR